MRITTPLTNYLGQEVYLKKSKTSKKLETIARITDKNARTHLTTSSKEGAKIL